MKYPGDLVARNDAMERAMLALDIATTLIDAAREQARGYRGPVSAEKIEDNISRACTELDIAARAVRRFIEARER